jgi:ERCC4-type nuclease
MTMKIIIDTREQQPWDFPEYETVRGTVKTGDYSIEGMEETICIERKKSVSELAGNITKKRFFNELDRMEPFSQKFLILEFSQSDVARYPMGAGLPRRVIRKIRVKGPYILKVLGQIEEEYGITIIYAGNRANAMEIAQELLEQTYYDL